MGRVSTFTDLDGVLVPSFQLHFSPNDDSVVVGVLLAENALVELFVLDDSGEVSLLTLSTIVKPFVRTRLFEGFHQQTVCLGNIRTGVASPFPVGENRNGFDAGLWNDNTTLFRARRRSFRAVLHHGLGKDSG